MILWDFAFFFSILVRQCSFSKIVCQDKLLFKHCFDHIWYILLETWKRKKYTEQKPYKNLMHPETLCVDLWTLSWKCNPIWKIVTVHTLVMNVSSSPSLANDQDKPPRLVISGGVMAGCSFKSPFSEGWWDSEKICQKFQKSGFNYSLFSTKNTKRHFFWKGACFFEKKRAPARNARNRDEERVFLKKKSPC